MDKPEIVSVIEREGVTLKRGKGLCPFHHEKTPSFTVNPKTQRFHCFGCEEKGDAVDFIMKLKRLSFKEALTYLGMKPGKPPRIDVERERERTVQRKFNEAIDGLYRSLCAESRELHQIRIRVQDDPSRLTDDEAVDYARCMGRLTEVDYALDLLWDGTAEEQAAVLKEYRL
jgi:DNA primase